MGFETMQNHDTDHNFGNTNKSSSVRVDGSEGTPVDHFPGWKLVGSTSVKSLVSQMSAADRAYEAETNERRHARSEACVSGELSSSDRLLGVY
jgi:hypothetical protein